MTKLKSKQLSAIRFEAKLFLPDASKTIGVNDPKSKGDTEALVRLTKSASAELPNKGMSFAEGKINGQPFETAVEPDGEGSHWFALGESLLKAAKAKVGDKVIIEITPAEEWPEPKLPSDFKKALDGDAKATAVFGDITPAARWDWIRWIGACKTLETRNKRIEVALSKMKSGKRRPCCFDRQQCTLTDA